MDAAVIIYTVCARNKNSLKTSLFTSECRANASIYRLNKRMPISKPNLLLVIICSVMVIVLQGYGDTILPKLRYESTLFHTKEYWRLLSGHFVHLSWMHAFLNLVGVWMLAFIFDEIVKLTTLLISILFIAMGVSLGLFYLNPDIDWYVGLSGVLE